MQAWDTKRVEVTIHRSMKWGGNGELRAREANNFGITLQEINELQIETSLPQVLKHVTRVDKALWNVAPCDFVFYRYTNREYRLIVRD
jgi:hypothetical protein